MLIDIDAKIDTALFNALREQVVARGSLRFWQSVEESKPEDDVNVLIYRPLMAQKIVIGFLSDGVWHLDNGIKMIHGNETVTHWMPLPDPPA